MVQVANKQDVRRWLEGKPASWAIVIASRAALRVLPVLTSGQPTPEFAKALLLPVCRISVLAAATAAYSAEAIGSRLAASASYVGTLSAVTGAEYDSAVSAAAFAAISAAEAAHASKGVALTAASAVEAAATAAHRAAHGTLATSSANTISTDGEIWQEVQWDLDALDRGEEPMLLARAALWAAPPNEELSDQLGRFLKALTRLGETWAIWGDWYVSRVEGKPSFDLAFVDAEAIDLRLASEGNSWWRREPAEINSEIAAWVEATRARSTTVEFATLDGGPSGSRYNLLIHGRDDAWGPNGTSLARGRVLEHTPGYIQDAFRDADASSLMPLAGLPTLIAYEQQVDKPARVGRIVDIHNTKRGIDLWVGFDEGWKPIPAQALAGLYRNLGFENLEQHRTHWAVKPIDLLGVLREAGYQAVRPTIAKFIVYYLRKRGSPARNSEIERAFKDANYPVIPKTVRGELSRLASSGQIRRIQKGLYAAWGTNQRMSCPFSR